MTVDESVYGVVQFTEYITDHGTLVLQHELTIGDMLVATSIATLTLFLIIKFFIDKMWR